MQQSACNLISGALLPVVLPHGERVQMTLCEALSSPDAASIETGHPYVDMLGFNLVTSLLQTAMPPASQDEWTERLLKPPSQADIEAALFHLAPFFDLEDTAFPLYQIAFEGSADIASEDLPSGRRGNPRTGPKKGNGAAQPDDAALSGLDQAEDTEEDDEKFSEITSLLPDEATKNQRIKSGEHFTKRGRFGALGAFATATLLQGINLVSVGGGGGFLNPDVKKAALAFLSVPRGSGITSGLWRSCWLNIQPMPDLPPIDPRIVFGWADPRQPKTMDKESVDGTVDNGRILLDGALHNQHPLSPLWSVIRRYRLLPSSQGTCSLTGIRGPVWSQVEKYRGGLRTALRPDSFHPLIGIEQFKDAPKGKPEKIICRVNQGPKSGVLRAAEWSAFLPAGASKDRDLLLERGVPPALASLTNNARKSTIVRLLQARGTPTLPLTAIVLRQDKVLEGWSEASLRIWFGDKDILGHLDALLAELKGGASDAEAIVDAAVGAAEARATGLRTGKDAGDRFKSVIKAKIKADVEVEHETIGEKAIGDLADHGTRLAPEASPEDEDRVEADIVMLRSHLRPAMHAVCLGCIERADFTPLGGLLVKAAAMLAAQAKAVKLSKKGL